MTDLQHNASARPPLTEEELAAIAARAEAATPGPWVECTVAPADTRQVYSQSREHDCIYSGEWVASFATMEDAAFAVGARDDVPRLVADGRHLRAKLAEAEAELDRLRAQLADAPADY